MVAVGAVIFCFSLVSPVQLEEMATDLAHQLRSLFAVIVIEVVMGSTAAGASGMFRRRGRCCSVFYGRYRFAVF